MSAPTTGWRVTASEMVPARIVSALEGAMGHSKQHAIAKALATCECDFRASISRPFAHQRGASGKLPKIRAGIVRPEKRHRELRRMRPCNPQCNRVSFLDRKSFFLN